MANRYIRPKYAFLFHSSPPHRSPRTHRARIIAAKRMAASNSTALAEILGIPSTSSTSSLSSPYTSTAITPTHTPTPVPAAEEQEPLTKLTTSSQSVGDYFKAKLSAKARGERQPHLTVATGDNASTSTPTWDGDDHDHRPGLGLDKGASRMLATATDELNEEQAARGGIGATKSSKFAAMFTTQSQPAADSREDNAAAAIELVEAHDATDRDDDCRKREKRRAKEERRREKEERRRRKAEAGRLDDAVVDVPVGEAPAGRTKKRKRKRNEHGAPDGGTQLSCADGTGVIRTKKRKGDKDKKSAKHGRPTG